MTDPADRRRTCVHEAGHAVAQYVLGDQTEYVSVRPGKAFRGIHVQVKRQLTDIGRFDPFTSVSVQSPALRADVERKIVVFLAGDIAALLLAPHPLEGYQDDEADRIARQALDSLGPRLSELVVANERSDDYRP